MHAYGVYSTDFPRNMVSWQFSYRGILCLPVSGYGVLVDGKERQLDVCKCMQKVLGFISLLCLVLVILCSSSNRGMM